METLEGKIRRYISQMGEEKFLDDGIPDLFRDDPEQLFTVYLFKIFDLINSRIEALRRQHGAQAIQRALIDAALGATDNELAISLMKNHFEELLPGQEEIFGTTSFDEYINADSTSLWDRVLLFIGVSPKYKELIKRYFGEDGLVSLAIFLQALATGRIDISLALRELQDTE